MEIAAGTFSNVQGLMDRAGLDTVTNEATEKDGRHEEVLMA